MDASARTVLFLAPEALQASLTGPARRTVKLAETVGHHCSVTLAAPSPSVFPEGPFRTIETGPVHDQNLTRALGGHDVAVVQALPSPRQLLTARRCARRLVVDLIAPLALEAMETDTATRGRRAAARWGTQQMLAHVAVADLVLCSNERQRDLLIGAALAADRLTADGAMPPLHERLVVVPHGLELESLCPGRSTLRTGALADEGLRLALWAGGMWSWLDPLTAIKAVERLRAHRPELRLAFVGTEHPDPDQRRAHAGPATHAAAYVRDHGLEEVVIFRPQWLSRREYVDHLVDADVGVSLNGSTLEARYASRTRVVDYLSAGLPVVCTGGDTMSDLVAAGELGMVVDAGDVDGCAAALDRLTQGAPRRIGNGAAVESLRWSNVAWPLVEFCLGTTLTPSASRRASLAAVARTYPAFVRAIHRQHGAGALAGAVARRAARLMRRQ